MKDTMKALVWHDINKISLDDVAVPRIQQPHDVIGKVTMSTICTSDVHIVEGYFPTCHTPLILGHEFCIEVVETGEAVKDKFPVGKHYTSTPLSFCGKCEACAVGRKGGCKNGGGFGIYQDGCQAEYIRIPDAESCLIEIPDGLTERDVLLAGDMLATAYFGIKNANVKEGQTVAVVGLGPVGFSACVLLKKVYHCKVIAITGMESSLKLARDNGEADVTISRYDPDLVQKVMENSNHGADAVIETAGTQESMNEAFGIVKYEGCVSTVAAFGTPISVPFNLLQYKNIKIAMGLKKGEGLDELIGWIKNGTIDTKFILTHSAPLNDIVKGYEVFGGLNVGGKRADGCIKWVVTPYEEEK